MKKSRILAATLILGLLTAPSSASAKEVIVDGHTLYRYVNDNGVQNDLLE